LKKRIMTEEELEDKLNRIKRMDPYWQKWEWWNLRLEQPEVYKQLKEYNDRPKKT